MFEPSSIDNLGQVEVDNLSVEEVFMDTHSERHSSLESDNHNPTMIKVFTSLVLIALLIMGGRLFELQIGEGGSYLLAAEGNRVRTLQKFAPRGLIKDRYGEVIVRNIPSFELVAVPTDLPGKSERARIWKRIEKIIKLNSKEIESKIEVADLSRSEPVLLKQSLTQEQALRLEDIISAASGLKIQNTPVREYLDGPAFSHITGYVGKLSREEWQQYRKEGYFYNDVIGKTGIELVYENHLRGKHGGIQVEVDAEGRIVKQIREIEPEVGKDLTLTIDAGLQKVLYQSLQEMLNKISSATGAAAVITNPATGEILSMVSLPSFDNNLFAKGINSKTYSNLRDDNGKPLLNRVLGGTYPPGSTIKPVIAAAALEEGVIDKNTKINDEGAITVGGYTFHGWDRSGLGIMDVVSAIAESSDPFFYVIGGGHENYGIDGLGVQRIVEYLRKFNLGEELGVNLPSEEPGFVPTPEWKKNRFVGTDESRWYLGNTYHLSIGQGYLLTTPMQVNAFTNAIANNGKILKPRLTNLESKGIETNIEIEQKYIDIVQEGMRGNVTYGSGVRLSSLPIEVAGKTGTAQFTAADLSKTHAWYTGYAPYDDPEISFTILVESGGEGHSAAVPVAQQVLQWWAENRLNN